MWEEKSKKIEQEEVNLRLQEIGAIFKRIPNIGSNYMEYWSVMIYAVYQNKEKFSDVRKIRIQEMPYIARMLDMELERLREKEQSWKLFTDIRFENIINRANFGIFMEVIDRFVNLISEIQASNENSKPMLAQAFEDYLEKAAQNHEIAFQNGKFYTPRSIVETMVKLVNLKSGMAIYNPACGTGDFMIESAKQGDIYAFGEESNISYYNICQINLWLHDVTNKRIIKEEHERIPIVDIAIANPPFTDINKRSIYIEFLNKMLHTVHENGKVAMIVPQGFLFRKSRFEYHTRRELIDKKYLEAIIGLPEKLFYDTKIAVAILMINKRKTRDEILWIDASREYEANRKNNVLTEENQKKILSTYQNWEVIPNYSYIARLEEVREKDYDLSIKRYVQIRTEEKEINPIEVEERIHQLEEERCFIQEEIEKLMGKAK